MFSYERGTPVFIASFSLFTSTTPPSLIILDILSGLGGRVCLGEAHLGDVGVAGDPLCVVDACTAIRGEPFISIAPEVKVSELQSDGVMAIH